MCQDWTGWGWFCYMKSDTAKPVLCVRGDCGSVGRAGCSMRVQILLFSHSVAVSLGKTLHPWLLSIGWVSCSLHGGWMCVWVDKWMNEWPKALWKCRVFSIVFEYCIRKDVSITEHCSQLYLWDATIKLSLCLICTTVLSNSPSLLQWCYNAWMFWLK